MNRALPVLLAAALASACAPRVWVQEGDRHITVPALETTFQASPLEPTYCIMDFHDYWGGDETPLQAYGGSTAVVEKIRSAGHFRSLLAPVLGAKSNAACDLMVHVGLSDGDAAGTRCVDFLVGMPDTGAPIWHGHACARHPLPYLARAMHATFMPGDPYFERYQAAKREAADAAGRPAR